MSTPLKTLNDRYVLQQRAGFGGMATVYRAHDLLLGRLVAVKVLHESLTSDEGFLERFQQEAHAAASLSHPNIVTVHDIGQDGRLYFIVMEYIEGPTLKQLIRQLWQREGTIPVSRAIDLAIQICDGVGYAHRANLIHCDVKSQNVLITPDDRVKVTDFGIARAFTESSAEVDSAVWGTPQYFSPEQAAGRPISPASDVYSIGVILFELLTGRLPYEGESQTELTNKHILDPPPRISEINPLVPGHLDLIVAKVLSKEPAGRYRTAEQFARVLRSYRENSLADTGPISARKPVVRDQESKLDDDSREDQFSPPVIAQTRPKFEPRQSGTALMPKDLHYPAPVPEEAGYWVTIVLGVVALITLLGLIPLWYLVFLRYTG